MNKPIKLIICLTVVLLLLLTVACQTKIQLPAPKNLAVISGVLEWEKVPNASGYEVAVDEDVFYTNNSYFSLSDIQPGSYTLKVRSIGNGSYIASDFSEEIAYTKHSGSSSEGLSRLPTPSIIVINGEGVVQWRSITGASGYRLYVNNMPTYTVSGGSSTSYTLVLSEPGNYSIQLQAIGVSGQSLDSLKSSSYGLVIKEDGTPKLPPLVKPVLNYNHQLKALEWQKSPLAEGYIVLVDGVAIADAAIIIENNDVIYMLDLEDGDVEYTIKALGDNIAYGDSALSNAICFPLEVVIPPQGIVIEIVDIEGSSKLALTWDEVYYSDGYMLKANGDEYLLNATYFDFSELEDGDYLVKVKSIGNGIYYKSSPYSSEIKVSVVGSKISLSLDAPEKVRYSGGTVSWDAVENASGYTIKLKNLNALTVSEVVLSENEYVFGAGIEDNYIVSVKANGDSLYNDSLWTSEIAAPLGSNYQHLSMPASISITEEGLEWSDIENASGYLLVIDGLEITLVDAYYDNPLLPGSYVVKVKALSGSPSIDDSPFYTTLITVPIALGTPDIEFFGGIIYYDAVENASSYTIYSNDAILAEQLHALYFDLRNVITIDGEYHISVKAVGEGVYSDSPRSAELIYIKTDADKGTEDKPIVIATVADFLKIVNAPDAYYTINATMLDFSNGGIKMNLEPLFNNTIPFRGVILGNGCVIKNINIVEKNGISGIFGVLSGARIESLIFTDITLTGTLTGRNAGVIASMVYNSSLRFVNVTAIVNVEANNANIGVIAGTASGEIANCNVYVSIIVNGNQCNVGGIVGVMYGLINNSAALKSGGYNKLTVNGSNTKAGGIAATLYAETITDISANINITVNGNNSVVGGLLGYAKLTNISNSAFSGTVKSQGKGTDYVGGIGGQLDIALATNINISGNIESNTTASYIGGLAASLGGHIENITISALTIGCIADFATVGGVYAVGSVSLINNINAALIIDAKATEFLAGGLTTSADFTITDCTVNITITAEGRGVAGGLIAVHNGNIEGVIVLINIEVSGDINVGGIAGTLNGNISNTSLTGSLLANGDNIMVGGVAAISSGLIEDVNIGDLTKLQLILSGQNITAGGISGIHTGNIQAAINVEITANGSGLYGGVAAEADGIFDIVIYSLISVEDAKVGGAFGTLVGSLEGEIVSEIYASGSLTVGGVAAINYADIDMNIDTAITVSDGAYVIVGGIAGTDYSGLTASITIDIDIVAQSGDIGGAVGIGHGEYNVIAEGSIRYISGGEGVVILGGIAGYADKVIGEFVGNIDVDGYDVTVGGIAGSVNVVENVAVKADLTVTANNILIAGVIAGEADYSNNCNPNGSSLIVSGKDIIVGAFGRAAEINNIIIGDIIIIADAQQSLYYGFVAGQVNTINNATIGAIDAPLTIDIDTHTAIIGGAAGFGAYGGSLNNVYVYSVINVEAQSAAIGGIAGKGSAFTECLSHSTITFSGDNAVIGGISSELISASTVYFAGSINANADMVTVGGFVGEGVVDISNCYVSASVFADADNGAAGLFAGSITGMVTSSYATGSIGADGDIELTDYSDATLSFAYIDALTMLDSKKGINATLGYGRGYLSGFNHNWTLNVDSYPILEPLAAIQNQENSVISTTTLDSINLNTDVSVNDLLPSNSEGQLFELVTWVSSDADKIKVINGIMYRYIGGEVELNGLMSGGGVAYTITIDVTEDLIAGTGNDITPYVIDSIKWIHYLNDYKDAWFVFGADIDISYYTTPIGDSEEPFSGNIQGNNHIISGFSLLDNHEYSGFFGVIDGAIIKDLRFEDVLVNIDQVDYAGAFAAKVINSELTNITISGSVAISNALSAGGLIGMVEDSIISYLGYNGKIVFNYCDFSGGLIGLANNSAINKTYANVELVTISEINYGGLVGFINNTTSIQKSYAATIASGVVNTTIAGFIYENDGAVSESYAVIQSNFEAYNFAYINSGSFSDCYAVLPTFVNFVVVSIGTDAGISAKKLTEAAGILFASDADWVADNDMLPRLADIEGQSGITAPLASSQSIAIVDMDIVDLSQYISITAGVFGVAEIASSDTDKLFFDEDGYAVALENAVEGELFVTFTFEGGNTIIIEVTIYNTLNPDFYSGYGTILSPFIIKTAQHFASIVDYPYAYFRLDSNITLPPNHIKGEFAGYLDGNGYTVTTTKTIFASATGSIINLNINANITVIGTQYAAVVTDYAYNLLVNNMILSYVLNAQNVEYAGAITAYGEGVYFSDIVLINCVLVATGEYLVAGGLAGYLSGNYPYKYFAVEGISGSLNILVELAEGSVGGIVGYSTGAIMDIDITISLIVEGNGNIFVGGIVGRTISECVNIYVIADIAVTASFAGVFVGGVAGDANAIINAHVEDSDINLELIIDSYNLLSGEYPLMTIAFFGGIAGNLYSGNILSVVNTELSVDFSATAFTSNYNSVYIMSGGVVGMVNKLEDTYFASSLTINSSGSLDAVEKEIVNLVGAIAGYLYSAKNLSAEGEIVINVSDGSLSYAGGIVGWIFGEYCEHFALAFVVSRIEITINADALSEVIAGGIAGINDTEHHDHEGCEHEHHDTEYVFMYCYYDLDLFSGDLFGEGELDEDAALEVESKTSIEIVDELLYPELALIVETVEESLYMDCWQRDIWIVLDGRIPYIDGRNL